MLHALLCSMRVVSQPRSWASCNRCFLETDAVKPFVPSSRSPRSNRISAPGFEIEMHLQIAHKVTLKIKTGIQSAFAEQVVASADARVDIGTHLQNILNFV